MRKKVVFVCVGNACRSQMAEAFARAYGADVIEPSSAGLAPAAMIPGVTLRVMEAKGLKLDGQFPTALDETPLKGVDVVVNLSGVKLRGLPVADVREWKVEDPIGKKDEVHERVRDQVEGLVMALILELRQSSSAAARRI
ncbi:MAG: hypothetical protein HY822_24120 [Acidobacteria bacterium]|nr:hypothetical protein [Acidobacteriota bacterium]